MRVALLFLLFLFAREAAAQDSARAYVLHDSVGVTIDRAEKVKCHLFPFWADSTFDHAEFRMNSDSSIVLVGTMVNGTQQSVTCSAEQIHYCNFLVRYYHGLVPTSSPGNGGAILGSMVAGAITSIITIIESQKRR